MYFILTNSLHSTAQDDLIIEYKDEYGRDRRGKKSEVPPDLWPEHMRGDGGANDDDDDDQYAIILSPSRDPLLIVSLV